jgi:LysR family transcriptional regulator, cell division regulator
MTLLPRELAGATWNRHRVAMRYLPDGAGRAETVFIRHRDAYATSALRAFLNTARPAFTRLEAAE